MLLTFTFAQGLCPDCGRNACSMHPPVLVRCNHGSGTRVSPRDRGAAERRGYFGDSS